MTISEALALLLKSLAIFGGLLLLGTALRAKIKILQNLYLPACVIGGTIGFIFGPNVLNIIPFGEDVMSVASALPGVLIIPILSSLPLCISLGALKGGGGEGLRPGQGKDIILVAGLICFFPFLQFALGLLVNLVCTAFGLESFTTMGMDMAMGFMGGHGMAASLGTTLQAAGDPNWEIAQGMANTTATVGMIGGIISGVALLNYAARKGYTVYVKSASETPLEMRTGYFAKGQERPAIATQTTVSNSIETLSLHFAVIFLACGGGYVLQNLAAKTGIEVLVSMATWFYGLLVMLVLWLIICALKVDFLFDETVKNKVNGILSDFMIVAAIMSIPIKVVVSYWIPLVLECAVGLLFTVSLNYMLCKMLLRNDWFETSLGPLGSNTGVFVTGMLLIKMGDPDLRTSALTTYSLGYTLPSVLIMPMISFLILLTFRSGTFVGMVVNFALALVTVAIMYIICRKPKTAKAKSSN